LAAVPCRVQGKLQAAFPFCVSVLANPGFTKQTLEGRRLNSGGLPIPLYSRAAATAGSGLVRRGGEKTAATFGIARAPYFPCTKSAMIVEGQSPLLVSKRRSNIGAARKDRFNP
jgi:hypothetical protein